MSRVSSILSNALGHGARATKFEIIINPPSNLYNDYSRAVDVLCKSVSVPSITNEPIEIRIKGHPVKIPGRTHQSQTLNVTFYVDEDLKIRQMFQDWIYSLDNRSPVGRNSNTESMSNSNTIDKFGNAIIIAKDFNESKDVMVFLVEHLFPTNISDMSYGSADKDTILELTVEFAFERFLTKGNGLSDSLDNLDNFLDQFGIVPHIGSNYSNSGSNFGSGIDRLGNIIGSIRSGLGIIGSVGNLIGGIF